MKHLGTLASITLLLAACHGSEPSTAIGAKALGCDGYPRNNGSQVTVCEARPLQDIATRGAPSVASTNADVMADAVEAGTINGTAYAYATAADEARANALLAGVGVTAENDGFHGSAPADLQPGENWGVGFDLDIPAQSNLSVTSTNGNTRAQGFSGTLHFNSENGNIDLEGLAGNVNIDAVNGNAVIVLTGTEWGADGVYASSTNGNVSYQAPADYNGHFQLHSQNGSAHSDFDGACSQPSPTDSQCDVTVGNGGSLLSADATNGNAELLRR